MIGVQACYRILSWCTLGLLALEIAKRIPGLYYYSLDWRERPPIAGNSHSDPLLNSFAHGQSPSLIVIALGSLPLLLFLAFAAYYWHRLATREDHRALGPALAACALSASAAWLALSGLEGLRWDIEVWTFLGSLPNPEPSSLFNITAKGAALSLPFLVVMLSARPLLETWARWQGLSIMGKAQAPSTFDEAQP